MPSKKTAKKPLTKAVKKSKRKMNEFMTLLNKARKNKMPEFKYKGKTYKKVFLNQKTTKPNDNN